MAKVDWTYIVVDPESDAQGVVVKTDFDRNAVVRLIHAAERVDEFLDNFSETDWRDELHVLMEQRDEMIEALEAIRTDLHELFHPKQQRKS